MRYTGRGDKTPIGRCTRREQARGVLGELLRCAASGWDSEELHVTVGEGRIHEPLTVGRPSSTPRRSASHTRSACARALRRWPLPREHVARRRGPPPRRRRRSPVTTPPTSALRIGLGNGSRPCFTAFPVDVSIVTIYGYDTSPAPPFSSDVNTSRVPSRDQSGEPASRPKSVSRISEVSCAGAPTRRNQMSSVLPGASYHGTGVLGRCE